jgi:hypothetical protein
LEVALAVAVEGDRPGAGEWKAGRIGDQDRNVGGGEGGRAFGGGAAVVEVNFDLPRRGVEYVGESPSAVTTGNP